MYERRLLSPFSRSCRFNLRDERVRAKSGNADCVLFSIRSDAYTADRTVSAFSNQYRAGGFPYNTVSLAV